MKSLITGGAGFIGSHLAEELLARGHRVAVVDNLSTGSISNIEHLKRKPGFHYVIDTIMNRPLLSELVDSSDTVFHLAAAVGVRLIVESPVRTLDTNIRGTEVVLEAAAKKKKKVVLTSTSEVYGKRATVPFREDDDLIIGPPVCGRWSYACSKAIDEFLAISYQRELGLPAVVVRLFNTVGPRQTGAYGMVLPRFLKQAIAGDPITIYGNGRQSRCFGWVGDVVKALADLADVDDAVGSIFNIGSDEEVSINELAEIVKEATHSDSIVVHLPYDEVYGKNFEDMMRRVPDLGRVRNTIGFVPSKTLREIVHEVAGRLGRRTERYAVAHA